MHELALFAGAGGGLLAPRLLGWRTVCAVEIDSYCRDRLLDRQRDGYLDRFPVWDDVKTFDGRPWRGSIDVISGGFPCQDISAAGTGAGITGARSGLVFEMLRIVEEVRPTFVFAENSPHLRTKGLGAIIERFISMGYVGRVGVLGAGDIGAVHVRKRMWIVAVKAAYAEGQQVGAGGQSRRYIGMDGVACVGRWPITDPESSRVCGLSSGAVPESSKSNGDPEYPYRGQITDWWNLPRFTRVDDGVAHRLDRIKATGNGQVPGVAALAWSILTSDFR